MPNNRKNRQQVTINGINLRLTMTLSPQHKAGQLLLEPRRLHQQHQDDGGSLDQEIKLRWNATHDDGDGKRLDDQRTDDRQHERKTSAHQDRKSTRLNSSHVKISYA